MSKQTKIALVTGAAKRLGQAIAIDFAKSGWDVAIHYGTSALQAQETVAAIEKLGRRAIALHADLANEQEVNSLIGRCIDSFGLPDCLVNNASLFDYDSAQTLTYQKMDLHMRINACAPVALARDLHRARLECGIDFSHPAVVINLLDQKLANPNPDFFSYTLSKAALDHATTLLAQALAPTLRVVGLAPGITLTSGDQTHEEFKQAHTMTPLGYSSQAQDICAAVQYLANAHAVTGTTLYVDGGQHLEPLKRDVCFMTSSKTE